MSKNTPKTKGIRTAYQALAGAVLSYLAGLIALPAVREYTDSFVRSEGVAALLVVLGAFGVSAGVLSWLQNKYEDEEK